MEEQESLGEELASRGRRLVRIYAAMVVGVVVLELLATRGLVTAPHVSWRAFNLVTVPFMAFALIGSLLAYALTRPRRVEWLVTVAVAACLCGLALLLHPEATVEHRSALLGAIGSWLGLAGLAVLFTRFLRASGAARQVAMVTVLSAAALPAFVTLTVGFLDLTVSLHPRVYDGYVYAADASFGVQPNVLVYRLFVAIPAVQTVSAVVYNVLPLAIFSFYALEASSSRRPPVDTLVLFIAAGTGGFVLYHLFPVVGPALLFDAPKPPTWPSSEHVPLSSLFAGTAARNCMPSLHTTWALLMAWQARAYRPLVRRSALAFLLFTMLATLGFGYHYLCDLIAAVPFSLTVWAGCATTVPLWTGSAASPRFRAISLGALLTGLWFVGVRFGLPLWRLSPVVPWTLGAVVVVTSLALWTRVNPVGLSGVKSLARVPASP